MDGRPYHFATLLGQVERQLLARKGELQQHPSGAVRLGDVPVITHFLYCSDEEAMDFIELCFQAETMGGDSEGARMAVTAMNRIFEEEGLGYELTLPATIDIGPGTLYCRSSSGIRSIRTECPRIIRKDQRSVHEKAVQPALEVLGDPRFATANSELLDAFDKVRMGKYPMPLLPAERGLQSLKLGDLPSCCPEEMAALRRHSFRKFCKVCKRPPLWVCGADTRGESAGR